MTRKSTSCGSMYSGSNSNNFWCPVCDKTFFWGMEINNVWYYKHHTKAGNVLYCDSTGTKRSKHKPVEIEGK